MYRSGTKNRRGFGLMIVLIMLGIVSVIAGSVAIQAQRSMQTSHRQSVRFATEDAAFSGLQVGLASIEASGDTWPGTGGAQSLPQRPALTYQVFPNSNFNNTVPINDPDGTEIPPKAVYLKSVGYRDGEAVSGMTAIVSQEEGTTFNYPAFATDGLTFNNTTVDAIDASLNPVPDGAPIRTNGDAAGAITLSNGSFVDGDVTVGTLADPTVALVATGGSGFSGTSNVAGSDLPLPNVAAFYDDTAPTNVGGPLPFPLPPPLNIILGGMIPLRFSHPAPGTYSALHVDEATMGVGGGFLGGLIPTVNIVILDDGDYFVSEFTTADGPAYITTGNNTRLHVRDTISTAAASTTIGSSSTGPAGVGLQTYQTAPGGTVSLQATDAKILLAAQGPTAVLDSQISGAIYGSTVDMTDSALTYRTELDGLAVSANVSGSWNLFGTRRMTPLEVEAY